MRRYKIHHPNEKSNQRNPHIVGDAVGTLQHGNRDMTVTDRYILSCPLHTIIRPLHQYVLLPFEESALFGWVYRLPVRFKANISRGVPSLLVTH